MSQLIQSFFENVQRICISDNESDLIDYLSNNGLVSLKQLFNIENHTTYNPIQCRDFGLFLIKLIPICYSHISDDDAEQALCNIPLINTHFNQQPIDHSKTKTSKIFETLDYIFAIIVRLFQFPSNHDNHTLNVSISEINNVHVEIAQAFVHLSLPELTTEYKVLWFYQTKIRSLFLIFRQIISFQPSTFTNSFTSNPIGSIITIIYNYLSSSASSSQFLIQLGFDTLQGFALLIESTLCKITQTNSVQRRTINDLLNLINQFLISDYFSLFNLLHIDQQNESNAKELLEHCSIILKRLKIYRSETLQRKKNRRIIQTYWENSYEQAYISHHHQNSFEITINNKNNFDGNIEIKNDNDDNNQTKRICVISAIYDKLLRLSIKQLESSQPLFSFIQDCLFYLTSIGSCSCYSLSHYRILLSKLNHLKTDEKIIISLEQQSIKLFRQAFLLISNCCQRNHHYHHYDTQIPDNTLFWSYLSNHLFQRSTHYSIKLIRSFPDLIQCCSINDKQLALQFCIIPSLEYHRANISIQNPINIEIIEYLIQTLPNLLFDIIIDIPLLSLFDTLISLSSLLPSLLIHTLPALGCLLTSTSNRLNLNLSEKFLHLVIKLINSWSLSNDSIDNLCHILIILLQKCSTFRQIFYANLCHLSLYERFQLMLNNKLTIQSSVIASIFVSLSYYNNSNDNNFNYKLIIEQITLYSEKNRYNRSWFELLVRLSLSQQYQDKRTRWKNSNNYKNQPLNEIDDENSTKSILSVTNTDVEIFENLDDDDVYYGDVESLSDDIPIEKVAKQNQTIYSNLILFPELVILGLKITWQNVDNEWCDQQTTNKTSIYVINLVTYLELLSSLVRANSYNCIVLKRLNIDGYLFTCLTKIVPRSSFTQKDALISLIITLLQFLWSQSITVNQLDECFKLILIHRSLVGPLLRLFKHLVQEIDSNQPRSFCSMPLSSIVTSKGGNNLRLTLDQLFLLKYPQIENNQINSSINYNNVRQSAFVTETLKTIQFHFPLSIAIWLKVNYPYDKHETNDENQDENEESIKKDYRPMLHILTLHHEGIQLQFWLDSKPSICFKIVQLSSTSDLQQLVDYNIRLCNLPRESWSHVFLTISKITNTVRVCLNGQTSLAKNYSIPQLYSSNSTKPWSISLGQESLDTCTIFYYDLGSILLFDRVDLPNGINNDCIPTYLFSLGSDHWHFLTGGHQQQLLVNYWIYQRFTRVHPSMPIDQFEIEQNSWHTVLKRSLLASYSSNNPWTLFIFNTNNDINEDNIPSRFNKILPFRSSSSSSSLSTTSSIIANDDNLLTTTTTISLPSRISLEQSSNILNICEQLGGILNFIYLFGKVVEINTYPSSSCICHISDIIFTSIWKVKSYYDLFNSLDGYRLIVKILTTNECTRHISNVFYELLINKCIILNQQRLYDINLFCFILLEWRIWYNHSKIFYLILKSFDDLLSDQINSKYFYVNRQLFKTHFTLEHFLILCQEIIEEQQEIIIDKKLTELLVNIIEALVENDINIIALLMNFVLLIHPLIKTYVTYNKEHFYFITKSFNYYQTRKIYQKENLIKQIHNKNNLKTSHRKRATTLHPEEQSEIYPVNNENSNVRKSYSYSDLLSSTISIGSESDTYNNRRVYHKTISCIPTTSKSPSTTLNIESNLIGNKDCSHNIDYLSTGILRLLTNIALTASDRLMMKLIDHVFRLNILIVLLLDASMTKRIQCIKLLDIILKRMDKDKVQNDVLRADLHTMLANQIYHQLDGRDDEKELVEICVSIALQRPIQFDIKLSLSEQIHDTEQYFSILSSSPPCPRSQVGFALVLSFIEKLTLTNIYLCELILKLLDQIILQSCDENRHFLVDIGVTQVLFNTLSSAISISQEKIIICVQKCFNSLITTMFTTSINDDISFISIINNIVGMIMMNDDIDDKDCSKMYRRIFHQTLSNMLNSILDSIEKLRSHDIISYQSKLQRNNLVDINLNLKTIEYSDRFRKFLQLSLDYIYLFHNECSLFEIFTLHLLDICLLGIAYLIEKRSNFINTRHQMSLIMFRCGDVIKQIGQKLLTISLDPDKQRFIFRIQILKHIIDQPNSKAIMEYLLINDIQCYLYHQILIYLQIISNTIPKDSEFEQINNQYQNLYEQPRKSVDSGHSTITTIMNKSQILSNGEDSSSHTIHISSKLNSTKQTPCRIKIKISNEKVSTTDEEHNVDQLSSSTTTTADEQEIERTKSFDRSSSPSFSISSVSSELTSLQLLSIDNYQKIINSFRDLMCTINIQSLTANDNNAAQRRALTEYLLSSSPTTPSPTSHHSSRPIILQRRSFDWSQSASSNGTQLRNRSNKSVSPNRFHRRSLDTPSPSPVLVDWSPIVEEKRLDYIKTLNQTIDAIQQRLITVQKSALEIFTNVTISTITARAMEITQDVINLQGFERKKYLEHLRLTQSLDLRIKHLWHQLISQLTHEYGVWFEPLSYPKFWELDPTENPQRERRRLQRSYCLMEKRFLQPQIPDEILVNPPLAYLFDTRHYQSVNMQTVLYRNEKIEYQCRCMNVTPNNEIKGELLVGTTRIYFVADEQLSLLTKTKSINSAMSTIGYNYHSFNDDSNSFSFAIDDICEMYKRRYMLKDVALELFFINGITLMIAHVSINDRENLYRLLTKRNLIHFKHGETLNEVQTSWKYGQMTNFDYLMQLNKLAGRTYLDLMQYPIYPYIVATYDTSILDLRSSSNYRNLSKPIAIQHAEKEEKFIDIYTALKDAQNLALSSQQENEPQQQQPSSIFGHQSDPYHFASLYSNSGIVLHYLVRLLPYTRMFLDYQDNNFDCADRTFHDVKTSYWLSSFESTSDFKELIPEFYYLPEFLLNKQGFDFGKRQNGAQVSDVTVPAWSKRNVRLFVYALRQALESDYVTTHLHQWIDLIFGYKQTGKVAVDAINVYHAACYYGFPIENINDQLTQKAYYGIVRTYGQVPKQLFFHSHPSVSTSNSTLSLTSNSNGNDKRNSERSVFESKLPIESIHRQIIGIRWGDFIGSYDMPSPDYIKSYDCPVQVSSFAVLNTNSYIICLPSSSLIIYNEQILHESINEQNNLSQLNPLTMTLDTMIALKWNTPDCIVRCRTLKQFKTWYNFLVPIDDQDKITCCTSIDYRLLFMGKTSGLIEIYRIQRNKNTPTGIELIKRYLPFIAHRSPITCLYTNRQFSLLISASADGMLTLWDTNRLSYVRTYKQDNQTIYHLTSSETTGDIAYLSSSGSQWHLSYLTCNCDLIGCLTFFEQLNCLCFTSAPEGTCVNVLLGGFENGIISMWSTWDLTLLRQLSFPQLHSHAIIAMCIPKFDRRRLYVVDRDRHLHTIESRSSSSSSTILPQILFLS
ncbi:unnamed protein product [Rotaria sordida]|uniref:Lysosomal-trafficking regulator n=1 Tax=Rotaria sordida TaxID=392033 RepID=A0A814BN60_9BILA|nr:unnamed protein product [Rotaria sordida]